MELHSLLFDGFAFLAAVALAAFLLGGLALSFADLAGRDLGDRPDDDRRRAAPGGRLTAPGDLLAGSV